MNLIGQFAGTQIEIAIAIAIAIAGSKCKRPAKLA
ncbi:MAG: hypothetical protein ACI9UT_000558 [Flavobacteriales bacterium]|jgi:hypothetical protein